MKVEYKDHMGSDLSIINDAKQSFGKEVGWCRPEMSGDTLTSFNPDASRLTPHCITGKFRGAPGYLSKGSVGLIGFLARGCTSGEWAILAKEVADQGWALEEAWDNREDVDQVNYSVALNEMDKLLKHIKRMPSHWTPFGQTSVKLRITVAIPTMRQLDTSSVGVVSNEVSRRYVSTVPEFDHPELRMAAENVKQGSSDLVFDEGHVVEDLHAHVEHALMLYEVLIAKGVAPEVARFYLPQGVLTTSTKTGSLAYWARVYGLRSDPHAQKEVRLVANEIGRICSALYPISWAALTA